MKATYLSMPGSEFCGTRLYELLLVRFNMCCLWYTRCLYSVAVPYASSKIGQPVYALFRFVFAFSMAEDRFPTSHFVRASSDGTMQLSDRFQGTPVGSTRGLGIFFDKAGETTPLVFSQFVLKLTAIPEVIIFFHLRPLETPSVSLEDMHSVSRLALPNCYRLVVRYGYNDEIISPDLASVIVDQIRKFLVAEQGNGEKQDTPCRPVTLVDDDDDAMEHNPHEHFIDNKTIRETRGIDAVVALERAYQHKVLYIMGKEQMKITKGTRKHLRNVLLWMFLWIRDNTRNKMANLRVPTDKVIKVGFLKEI